MKTSARCCGVPAVKSEKIAFIMDESNVLDSGFLERMNTLLASSENWPLTCRAGRVRGAGLRGPASQGTVLFPRCPASSREMSTPP